MSHDRNLLTFSFFLLKRTLMADCNNLTLGKSRELRKNEEEGRSVSSIRKKLTCHYNDSNCHFLPLIC